MPIFIWISEGPTGEDAKPLLASTDPQVIDQFLQILHRRIRRGVDGKSKPTGAGTDR